ncbi:M23 family metallopeptidase [Priestia megaterium]|nr:M23 family metallopeptidase [Priestia megaterium]
MSNREIKVMKTTITDEFAADFLNGEFAKIYEHMSAELQKELAFKEFFEVSEAFNEGVEKYRLETALYLNPHLEQYIWIDLSREKGISLVVNENDVIVSLRLAPLTAYPESDMNITKNEYRMPITDEWFVFWGGTNQLVNYHYVIDSQRYAYDLVRKQNETTHYKDGKQNEDYYAFGQKVVAPADGQIVKVVNNIYDNPIGETNAEQPAGNYVVIDHGQSEYSLLAHFKHETIQVQAGEKVRAGQVIGLCGNSGNSSEAHIHFQVMDSPDLFNSNSLRIKFKGVVEPIKGDYIVPVTD